MLSVMIVSGDHDVAKFLVDDEDVFDDGVWWMLLLMRMALMMVYAKEDEYVGVNGYFDYC